MSDIGVYGMIYDTQARGGKFLDRLDLDSFSCEWLAVGGCWQASLSRSMNLQNAEDWYEKGLGREIKFFDQDGAWVWEGKVNKVSVNAGDITEVRGPLLDIVNRANCTYTPRDFSVYPPVDGSQTQTTILEDTLSQAQYGIVENVVSAGTCPEDTAVKVQAQYLNENALPKTEGQLSISPGSSQNPTVSIELIGKVQFMQRYIYEDTSTALSYLSDKIIAILAADPNNYISSNVNFIEENQYLVNDLEDKLRFAWDVMSELLTLGNDVNDNRRIFGLYENGVARYETMPTDIAYVYRLAGPQVITDYNIEGAIIRPWRIRPGRWITIPDFLIGRKIPSTSLYGDPRNHFIESVKYTAPYQVDLSGGQTSRLAQMLAKITYSGGIY